MKLKSAVAVIAALTIALFTAGCSDKQNETKTSEDSGSYPEKAITMIIPYSAGGTADVTGRQFAIQLSKHLNQTITVVNQAGASGSIGCKTVLDAPKDGYTLLYMADSLGTQRVMGISDISYNDYDPVMAVVNDPKIIVVDKKSKYNTLEDLLNDMKANPGKIKMSYTGPGGSGHVQGLILSKLGYDASMTAYPGGNECVLAVLGNQVDFTNANYSTAAGYIESGDLKLLGVSANTRLPQYPDVPTITEILPEAKEYVDIPFSPLSLLVAKGVSEDVQNTLREAAKKAVEEEDWKKFVEENNLDKLYEKYPETEDIKEFYSQWESLVSWLLSDAGATKHSPEEFNIPRP